MNDPSRSPSYAQLAQRRQQGAATGRGRVRRRRAAPGRQGGRRGGAREKENVSEDDGEGGWSESAFLTPEEARSPLTGRGKRLDEDELVVALDEPRPGLPVKPEPLPQRRRIESISMAVGKHMGKRVAKRMRLRKLSTAFKRQLVKVSSGGKTLSAVGLEISELDAIPKGAARSVERLLLSNNFVSDLSAIAQFPSLRVLSLANNEIDSFQQLWQLRECTQLAKLSVDGNPVCQYPSYRVHVIHSVPSLQRLDGAEVRAADRRITADWIAREDTMVNLVFVNDSMVYRLEHAARMLELHEQLLAQVHGRVGVFNRQDEAELLVGRREFDVNKFIDMLDHDDPDDEMVRQRVKSNILEHVHELWRTQYRHLAVAVDSGESADLHTMTKSWEAAFSQIVTKQQRYIAELVHLVEANKAKLRSKREHYLRVHAARPRSQSSPASSRPKRRPARRKPTPEPRPRRARPKRQTPGPSRRQVDLGDGQEDKLRAYEERLMLRDREIEELRGALREMSAVNSQLQGKVREFQVQNDANVHEAETQIAELQHELDDAVERVRASEEARELQQQEWQIRYKGLEQRLQGEQAARRAAEARIGGTLSDESARTYYQERVEAVEGELLASQFVLEEARVQQQRQNASTQRAIEELVERLPELAPHQELLVRELVHSRRVLHELRSELLTTVDSTAFASVLENPGMMATFESLLTRRHQHTLRSYFERLRTHARRQVALRKCMAVARRAHLRASFSTWQSMARLARHEAEYSGIRDRRLLAFSWRRWRWTLGQKREEDGLVEEVQRRLRHSRLARTFVQWRERQYLSVESRRVGRLRASGRVALRRWRGWVVDVAQRRLQHRAAAIAFHELWSLRRGVLQWRRFRLDHLAKRWRFGKADAFARAHRLRRAVDRLKENARQHRLMRKTIGHSATVQLTRAFRGWRKTAHLSRRGMLVVRSVLQVQLSRAFKHWLAQTERARGVDRQARQRAVAQWRAFLRVRRRRRKVAVVGEQLGQTLQQRRVRDALLRWQHLTRKRVAVAELAAVVHTTHVSRQRLRTFAAWRALSLQQQLKRVSAAALRMQQELQRTVAELDSIKAQHLSALNSSSVQSRELDEMHGELRTVEAARAELELRLSAARNREATLEQELAGMKALVRDKLAQFTQLTDELEREKDEAQRAMLDLRSTTDNTIVAVSAAMTVLGEASHALGQSRFGSVESAKEWMLSVARRVRSLLKDVTEAYPSGFAAQSSQSSVADPDVRRLVHAHEVQVEREAHVRSLLEQRVDRLGRDESSTATAVVQEEEEQGQQEPLSFADALERSLRALETSSSFRKT